MRIKKEVLKYLISLSVVMSQVVFAILIVNPLVSGRATVEDMAGGIAAFIGFTVVGFVFSWFV